MILLARGVEGAGPLANERRRRNFSRFALRHARSHLGPGPALPKLALDHSSPPQNGRPWTTLGDIGPTLDRVVQGWTNAEIAALLYVSCTAFQFLQETSLLPLFGDFGPHVSVTVIIAHCRSPPLTRIGGTLGCAAGTLE